MLVGRMRDAVGDGAEDRGPRLLLTRRWRHKRTSAVTFRYACVQQLPTQRVEARGLSNPEMDGAARSAVGAFAAARLRLPILDLGADLHVAGDVFERVEHSSALVFLHDIRGYEVG